MNLFDESKKVAWKYVRDIVITVVITYLLLHVFFNVVIVDGNSMFPALQDGEIILIQSQFYNLNYGDIVACDPENYNKRIIKRVIGMPGDTVDIHFDTGDIVINGEVINEPYIQELTHKDLGIEFPLRVKDGHLFLLGDNRNESLDSRSPLIGQVREEDILGKCIFPLRDDS